MGVEARKRVRRVQSGVDIILSACLSRKAFMRRVPLAVIQLVMGQVGHGSHTEAGVGKAALHSQLPLP